MRMSEKTRHRMETVLKHFVDTASGQNPSQAGVSVNSKFGEDDFGRDNFYRINCIKFAGGPNALAMFTITKVVGKEESTAKISMSHGKLTQVKIEGRPLPQDADEWSALVKGVTDLTRQAVEKQVSHILSSEHHPERAVERKRADLFFPFTQEFMDIYAETSQLSPQKREQLTRKGCTIDNVTVGAGTAPGWEPMRTPSSHEQNSTDISLTLLSIPKTERRCGTRRTSTQTKNDRHRASMTSKTPWWQ